MRKAALTVVVLGAGSFGVSVAHAQGTAPANPSPPPTQPPSTKPPSVPQILSVNTQQPKAPGQESSVRVRAVDQGAPISGVAAVFPDGEAFGISACRAPDSAGRPPGPPFTPATKVTFSLPHTFPPDLSRGVFLQVQAAGCTGAGANVFGNYSFNAKQRSGGRSAAASTATVLATASRGCRGAGARVGRTATRIRAARHALLCVLNSVRRSRGLRPLRSNRRLLRAAVGHSRSMVRAAFFSHVAPGGLGLVQRVRRTGYLSRAHRWLVGENIGFGRGSAASPAGMVRSWMGSTAHRANILAGQFSEIGLGVTSGIPGRPSTGATYTTDFGMRR
jgi:uncharacterized protein YkwD